MIEDYLLLVFFISIFNNEDSLKNYGQKEKRNHYRECKKSGIITAFP